MSFILIQRSAIVYKRTKVFLLAKPFKVDKDLDQRFSNGSPQPLKDPYANFKGIANKS